MTTISKQREHDMARKCPAKKTNRAAQVSAILTPLYHEVAAIQRIFDAEDFDRRELEAELEAHPSPGTLEQYDAEREEYLSDLVDEMHEIEAAIRAWRSSLGL